MPSRKRSEALDVTDAIEMPDTDTEASEAAEEVAAVASEAVDEVVQGWTSVYEATTRSAFDSLEQATNAWMEMQSLLWLWPLRFWNPGNPMTPPAAGETNGPASDWFGKFFAGTTPPQPMQESARELMTLGMRSWGSMWAPWTMWMPATAATAPWRTGGTNS